MYESYIFLLNYYSTRKSGCPLCSVGSTSFIRPYALVKPWVLALHITPPVYMVALLFCSRHSGIPVACIKYGGCSITKIAYFASYGLNSVFLTIPLALFDWLKMNVFSLFSTNMRVSFLMGGCWILHQYTKSRVAPNPSEQPGPGYSWLSPPLIKRSMMHIHKYETPLLFKSMVSSPLSSCHTLHPCWDQHTCFTYICHGNYLIKLVYAPQEMWVESDWTNIEDQTSAANFPKGWVCPLASEEH